MVYEQGEPFRDLVGPIRPPAWSGPVGDLSWTQLLRLSYDPELSTPGQERSGFRELVTFECEGPSNRAFVADLAWIAAGHLVPTLFLPQIEFGARPLIEEPELFDRLLVLHLGMTDGGRAAVMSRLLGTLGGSQPSRAREDAGERSSGEARAASGAGGQQEPRDGLRAELEALGSPEPPAPGDHRAALRRVWAKKELVAIEEAELALTASRAGTTQRDIAALLGRSQSDVHRLLRKAKLGLPSETWQVILRATAGGMSRGTMIGILRTGITRGSLEPGEQSDGYEPGSLDEIRAAFMEDLLTEQEYDEIRAYAPSRAE